MNKKTNNLNKEKPHVLIYAHYYYPDVASTGQILTELAEGLSNNFKITVICVVPSYSGTVSDNYKNKKYYYEKIKDVNIIRVKVSKFNKTKKISRIKNIFSYFFRSINATRKVKNVDYVFAISQPPIIGGILGVVGKWMKRAKFIYNIQDFNPEQINAVNYSKNQFALKMMMLFDKFTCRCSDKVIVVGRDMIETLKSRFKGKKIPKHAFINNWIDEEKIYPLELSESNVKAFLKKYGLMDKFVFMYSGNLGLYYDLENLLMVIKKFSLGTKTPDGKEVVFAFVGDGSIKDKLYKYKKEYKMDNVIFIPYQNKDDLNYSLNAANVHLCVNAKGIRGVSVPSKCYGIMAVGKPIIGVIENDSEIGIIITEAKCGLLSKPGDYQCIKNNIQWFIEHSVGDEIKNMGIRGRDYLVKELRKDISINKYFDEIMNC